MTTYRFSVEVSGLDPNQEGFENRFYGNGVDDALIVVSEGRVILAFDREADNESTAIQSAMQDIHRRGGTVTKVVWDNPRAAD